MGCDIHLYTEVKIDGKWHYYGNPSVSRNYEVFANMANCGRCLDIEPMIPNRGLPDDMSALTKACAEDWREDAHSHSWLASHEIGLLFEKCPAADISRWDANKSAFYLFGNGWDFECAESWPEIVKDFRWVFWFDN